jgi:phosphoglycolate phosphatase
MAGKQGIRMTQPGSRLAISALALDLDGTLLDTAEDIAGAVDATLVSLGLPALGTSAVRGFIGQGVAHLLRTALTRAGNAVEPAEELVTRAHLAFTREYGLGLCRRTSLYPGVREGLDGLRAAGFTLTCVTNKPERFTTPLLDALHLRDCFALVVSGDTLPVKKPDPGQLLFIASRLAVVPGRLLVVGDSIHDLRAARAAGCPTFCVTYGYTDDPVLLARQADAALDTLAGVLPRISLADSAAGFAPDSRSGPDSGPDS